MKYYKHEDHRITPNDFVVRIIPIYYKTEDEKNWYRYDFAFSKRWVRASDPTTHGIKLEPISKEQVFIEML